MKSSFFSNIIVIFLIVSILFLIFSFITCLFGMVSNIYSIYYYVPLDNEVQNMLYLYQSRLIALIYNIQIVFTPIELQSQWIGDSWSIWLQVGYEIEDTQAGRTHSDHQPHWVCLGRKSDHKPNSSSNIRWIIKTYLQAGIIN